MKVIFNKTALPLSLALAVGVGACGDDDTGIFSDAGSGGASAAAGAGGSGSAEAGSGAGAGGAGGSSAQVSDEVLRSKIKNVVVVYAENRSFDNLFGHFPGAETIPDSPTPQVDRDGNPLATLPQTWGGVTANGQSVTVTQAQSANLPNAPFQIDQTFQGVDGSVVTRDLYHRFFENQMQIDGGKNDKMVAWGDAGGLVLGYWDYSKSKLWDIAAKNVLADNFFQAAFGGSFLNHQYLICACAPSYANADTAAAKPTITVLDETSTEPLLKTKPACAAGTEPGSQSDCSPASALDGPPTYELSGNLAPKDYFGAGDGFRAINTMQPPFQPSGNAPPATDTTHLLGDLSKANTLPAQTQTTVGDLLTAKNVSWAWYAGAWNEALESTTATKYAQPAQSSADVPAPVAPTFQFHHQPFNYYDAFDPAKHADARAEHLKDYEDLVSDAAAGTLPAVAFYKPQGNLNQHPGYANVNDYDDHIGELVSKLQASPQYANMVIVITYDEFGGQWDHVAPPKADLLGPGTRIPAIIVSPFAKAGTVDHTQYDTGSILRLISRVYDTETLPGLTARDEALKANGAQAMGDLTAALTLE
jgi:acid phosphatase